MLTPSTRSTTPDALTSSTGSNAPGTGSVIRQLTDGESGPCIDAARSVALVTLRVENCVFLCARRSVPMAAACHQIPASVSLGGADWTVPVQTQPMEQAVRPISGALTAVIGASARTGPSVTPSQVRVCALTATRGGVVRINVNMATMAKGANSPVSV